jgi:hypothetical protein
LAKAKKNSPAAISSCFTGSLPSSGLGFHQPDHSLFLKIGLGDPILPN